MDPTETTRDPNADLPIAAGSMEQPDPVVIKDLETFLEEETKGEKTKKKKLKKKVKKKVKKKKDEGSEDDNNQEESTAIPTEDGAEAVSYTHLDVYKRQVHLSP